MNTQSNTSKDTNRFTNYTVTLEDDGNNLFMPIPDQVLEQLGWEEGDELEWGYCYEQHCITIRKELKFDS